MSKVGDNILEEATESLAEKRRIMWSGRERTGGGQVRATLLGEAVS